MSNAHKLMQIDGVLHKKCGHCKCWLHLQNFNKCRHAATGYRSQCKDCMKTQRQQLRDYYKKWREQPEKIEWYRKYARTRYREYPITAWARNQAKKLKREPCEECGDIKAEAHHDDYLKPLNVRWLCRRHHDEWHENNGRGKNFDAAIPEQSLKKVS